MQDHDGIMTLLQIPDPTEKKLALKSKLVEPYHLRHALQDQDETVRAAAAGHPRLTKELMSEILASDDKPLRHIVLARPDLHEDHLAAMAGDPEHALEVANHPRCTEDIRHAALMHNLVPEGVKALHSKKLAKNIGYLTYPLLGEGKVYTKPMGVKNANEGVRRDIYNFQDWNQAANRNKNTTGQNVYSFEDQKAISPEKAQNTGWAHTSDVKASPQTQGRMPDTMNPVGKFMAGTKVDIGKNFKATEEHEAQHSLFSRIAQKHGRDAMLRVVATTLSRLPEQNRQHIEKLFSASAGQTNDPTVDPEETIAYLHNYLQDPHHRNKVHAKLEFTPEQGRESMKFARKSWDQLRRIGMALRPEDVQIDPKDQQNRMSMWIKQLTKRESKPSDQLGFSVSFFEMIAICEFLTQRTVEQQVLRQAVRNADGDGLGGVLSAFGLNTPEGRKAFDSVKSLRLHKTEDILKSPKSIVGIDDPDFAEVILKAYKTKKIEAIQLSGKHSSGTYIAKDEEGYSWLLKPGSGKKSPAAGVDETKGSQSRREVLFSAIAAWMGIEEVQPAHLLQIDGKEVAAIRMWPMNWVNLHRTMYEDQNIPRTSVEPYRRNGKVFRWSVLDFVTGNPDRHGDNIMLGPADEGNKLGLIDHGSALAGHSFDPGNDQDSFVPYYLRVWAGPNFHGLPHEEQFRQMPTVTGDIDDELRKWVEELNSRELESICLKYGMDPGPCLARLSELQAVPMTEKMSEHTNKMWLEAPQSSSDSTL